jgi:flagellar motility protein MotE (MotC chaperone)
LTLRDHFDVRTLDAYEWGRDLVAVDDEVREAALARHHALLWQRHPDRPSGTVVDPVRAFLQRDFPFSAADLGRLESYAVLFLRWEARFPVQWRAGWSFSPWSAKEEVLGAFMRHGAQPETRTALEDLLIGAVHRVQRCQDGWYWRLARHIDGARLRAGLGRAAEHADAPVRLRARYVLWLIEHPDEAVTSRAWRRWRRTVGVSAARSASELAALPAADAAALVAGLSTAELAVMFEALEAGPGARIAAAIEDVAAVASAVEAMDTRTAARLLSAMPQTRAAELLVAMPADPAAARFPSPKHNRILRLMSPAQALDRLSAMAPTVAGGHLEGWPATDAAEMLTMMDPTRAAHALAAMHFWWQTGGVLAAMPHDVAAGLVARVPERDRARVRWDLETVRFRSAAQASIARSGQRERP